MEDDREATEGGFGGMVRVPGDDRGDVGLGAATRAGGGSRRRAGGDVAEPVRAVGALRRDLIVFIGGEASRLRDGERAPGATEVLESCFEKLKALEAGQSKSGFTALALSLGAMVSTWTTASLEEALERCPVKDVALSRGGASRRWETPCNPRENESTDLRDAQ